MSGKDPDRGNSSRSLRDPAGVPEPEEPCGTSEEALGASALEFWTSPVEQTRGAPPEEGWGAPPEEARGAPPEEGRDAPPAEGRGAPPEEGWGAPPEQGAPTPEACDDPSVPGDGVLGLGSFNISE